MRYAHLILSLFLLNQPVLADYPQFPGETAPGSRIWHFPTPKGDAFYLPMAFSSSLSCSPGAASDHKSCILRVSNSLTAEESRRAAQAGERTFWHVDQGIVPHVEERFRDVPVAILTTTSAETLALGSPGPYASFSFRLPVKEAEAVELAYRSGSGLGTFESEALIVAEETETYLALTDPSSLMEMILPLRNGATAEQIRESMKEYMRSGHWVSKGLTRDEAMILGYRGLISGYFKRGKDRRYRPVEEKLRNTRDRLVLLDETYSGILTRCKASLALKHEAVQVVNCEEE